MNKQEKNDWYGEGFMCLKVSVVVPVYNVNPDYMKTCMESIFRQTYRNMEIILVDDGSTDGSGALCDAFASMDSRVQVLHQKNQGVSGARNNGTSAATGEYIMYVDADDMMAPYAVEDAVQAAVQTDADLVVGGIQEIGSFAEFSAGERSAPTDWMVGGEELITKLKKQYTAGTEELNHLGGGSCIGRGPYARIMRSELAKNTPFPKNLPIGEDYLWNMALLNKSKKVCVVPSLWYGYLIYGTSAIRKYYGNREEFVSRYLKILWDENEQFCTENIQDYARNVALEYYCILNYDLLPEKSGLTNSERRKLARQYLGKEPWNILTRPEIRNKLPMLFRGFVLLCPSGLWLPMLRLKNHIKGNRRSVFHGAND